MYYYLPCQEVKEEGEDVREPVKVKKEEGEEGKSTKEKRSVSGGWMKSALLGHILFYFTQYPLMLLFNMAP